MTVDDGPVIIDRRNHGLPPIVRMPTRRLPSDLLGMYL